MRKAIFLFLYCSTLLRAEDLEQAATTFLSRWLLDGDIEKALLYVSHRGPFCVPGPETGELNVVTLREARERLREDMTIALKTLGRHTSLSVVIGPVPASIGHVVGKPGVSAGLPFTVWDVPARDLRVVTCDSPTKRTRAVIVFVFRGPEEREPAGAMYLVFERYFSKWRIVGFDWLRQ